MRFKIKGASLNSVATVKVNKSRLKMRSGRPAFAFLRNK